MRAPGALTTQSAPSALLRGPRPCSQLSHCVTWPVAFWAEAQSFLESGGAFHCTYSLQGGGGIVLVPGLAINESKASSYCS